VIGLVLRQSLTLSVVGVGIGVAATAGVSRLFRTLLVGVSATDAVSFASTSVLVLVVSLLAVLVPARRASRLDATRALRQD
jgi:ABC-type antimicrobial peptide transport system permease subunit